MPSWKSQRSASIRGPKDVFISSGVSGLSPRGQMKESVPCALENTFRRESPVSLLIFHFLSDDGHILGGRDHCHRAVRASILERPVLDIHNPSAGDIHRRSDGGIRDHDDTLSSSKLFVVGFRESDTDIATRCRPRKYDNGFEAFVGANISCAAIDLELVCLNGNLELPGVGISTRQTSLDKLDIGIRVIDPDRGRPSAFTCLFDPQRGLVVFRICGLYHEDSGCRVKVTVICCDSKSTLV